MIEKTTPVRNKELLKELRSIRNDIRAMRKALHGLRGADFIVGTYKLMGACGKRLRELEQRIPDDNIQSKRQKRR